MTSTHQAVINRFPCPTCFVSEGIRCINGKKNVMAASVHHLRMRCPICKEFYVERSGNGFRHVPQDQAASWCRLPLGNGKERVTLILGKVIKGRKCFLCSKRRLCRVDIINRYFTAESSGKLIPVCLGNCSKYTSDKPTA